MLGLEVISSQPDRVWLALSHDTRLGLWSPGGKEFGDRGGSHVHFAFAARRIGLPMLAERIRAAGIEVMGPVAHPGGDCSIYFQDPAGNVVEAWVTWTALADAARGCVPWNSPPRLTRTSRSA